MTEPRAGAAAAQAPAIQSVWLLAGSAGATGAVQRFLNQFHTVPPVAFIYAQHYDPERADQLQQFTLENNLFSLEIAEDGCFLSPGCVTMVPPQQRLDMLAGGRWQQRSGGWAGHTPDIDQLIQSFAAAQLPCPGVIVFSGMGDDGTRALPQLAAAGGRIWVQSPDDAVCAGMPRAAIATGLVQRVATASELARALQRTGY